MCFFNIYFIRFAFFFITVASFAYRNNRKERDSRIFHIIDYVINKGTPSPVYNASVLHEARILSARG